MQILLATDSFKGSLTSLEAARAICRGIQRACQLHHLPPPRLQVMPLADGGEGTLDALTQGHPQWLRSTRITGPDGSPVEAAYALLPQPDGPLAVIEAAQANGLLRLPPQQRNPLHTTTYGVGELIRCALADGARRFVVGLGGSATNDGGAGMLSALGVRCFDSANNPMGPVLTAKDLPRVASLDPGPARQLTAGVMFRVACDVRNPLCGPLGASAVFGPQKGATATDIPLLDGALSHFADVAATACGQDLRTAEGAGAAGGLGYAFVQFLNGRLESGIDLIMDALDFNTALRAADLVVTGEGRMDSQTTQGKAPAGVSARAKKYGKPVIAFCGSVEAAVQKNPPAGIDACYSCQNPGMTTEESMARAAQLLEECVAARIANHLM